MGQDREAAIRVGGTLPAQSVKVGDIGGGDLRQLLSTQYGQDMQVEIALVFRDRSRLFVQECVALEIDFGEFLQGRRAGWSYLDIETAAAVRKASKMLPGFRASRIGRPWRAVASDSQKALAAIPVSILQDVDSRMALAANAEAPDVRIPDRLGRCQLGDCFEGNPAN